ncbi:toll/interleukin-1 receptor domain-containing protein [uncultured Hyphomicrobium sp.]|uniref:toll/interleukin-1 receptor domain-containing protein n=1 Tax=uncultured Hyphomicrobium sp. TaxID=194373 RepID=UPI0025FAA0B9|nr:toll/interleukin-1 receptor domain-containing protein [uncultured Hyphomicrobium sp.]
MSYAREDLNWAERIEKALSPLTRNKKIELWFDRKIEPGEAWEKSVLSAIDRCDGALLLVSPSFLNSDYILSTELPKLFAAREQRGIFFLPIVISFCPYSLVESLTQFQMFNDPERPYSSLVDWQVDKELTRLVEEIATRAGKGKK